MGIGIFLKRAAARDVQVMCRRLIAVSRVGFFLLQYELIDYVLIAVILNLI